MMKKTHHIVFVICVVVALCFWWPVKHTQPSSMVEQVITPQHKVNTLYYVGKIEPVILSTISTPIDATVQVVHVAYGDKVHKGQALFELEANGDGANIAETIVDYLKLRDDVSLAKRQLTSANALFDAGVISQNERDESARKYNLNAINLIKSEAELKALLAVLDLDFKAVQDMSLNDLGTIDQLINMHRTIPIRANSDGVFLKGTIKEPNTLLPGVGVKKTSAFGVIADTNALKITINVPEADVNKLQAGESATITGDAFPTEKLQGVLSHINKYVFENSGGNEVTYPVEVLINHIPDSAHQVVSIGMSAKVAITQSLSGAVFVPIQAVKKTAEKTVLVKKKAQGGVVDVPVQVGKTTPQDIAIMSGLEIGDTIVFNN